jgi:hypothetical protein
MPRGYFGKSLPELRMPKAEDWTSEMRFRAEGPVMSGMTSPELAQAREVATVTQQQIASSLAAGTRPGHVQPEFYDPVLQFHCHLGKGQY